MEQVKALIITDTIKEPRTFEMYSVQMGRMTQVQQFEIALQDMEGYGTFYALLTHGTAPEEAIAHAIINGAKWQDVWVVKGLSKVLVDGFKPVNQLEKLIKEVSKDFFETCQPFCIFGDYKGDSYSKMHDYDTCKAIFSSQQDAIIFQELIKMLLSWAILEGKRGKSKEMLKHRPKIDVPERAQWEHLL